MVLYQVYPRSFQDSDGDGIGDIPGITSRIDYLHGLGVDGVWLNPIMASPEHDHGYDVSDPRAINPQFGTIDDLRELLRELHSRGMVLIMDLVPNHVSSEHQWFIEALAAPPGSSARERFFFRPGTGDDGGRPPNNWPSQFGGPAWERVSGDGTAPAQWYLHLFDSSQPDVNWDNPDIRADMDLTLRHWLDVGVDGFRIDVAHGMAKPPGLPDIADLEDLPQLVDSDNELRFDQPGVHELHRRIRAVVDEYPDRRTFAEAWIGRPERLARYLAPDELHHAFGFALTEAAFDAAKIRQAIDDTLAASTISGAAPTWALSNHDVIREASRYGRGEIGRARARAMALLVLALPGIAFVYAGAELGLEDWADIPSDRLTDPQFLRTGDRAQARDGARVPLPWSGTEPPYGFSTTVDTWLPQPPGQQRFTAEAQAGDAHSTLSLYREAITLRKRLFTYRTPALTWNDAPTGCISFTNDGGVHCLLNASARPVPFADLAPSGSTTEDVILSSTYLENSVVPANSAVWLRLPTRA